MARGNSPLQTSDVCSGVCVILFENDETIVHKMMRYGANINLRGIRVN